jgi:hypothetical protein
MRDYFQVKNSFRYDQSQFIGDETTRVDVPYADEATEIYHASPAAAKLYTGFDFSKIE